MNRHEHIDKIQSHIPGFDLIASGGLPKGRSTLVTGTTGSAKTVFAAQFLAGGILQSGESGIFVTFEETPEDIRRNQRGFGWDIDQWEAEGKWAFVDASPEPEQEVEIVGDFDFGALLARVEHAVRKIGAKRLVMDSFAAIFTRFRRQGIIRREIYRIVACLRKMGVTAILTAERIEEYGEIARYGVEEFVTDNVIMLRNPLGEEKRRRTIEILKFRGTYHQKGEWPFTVSQGQGISVLPLSAIERVATTKGYREFIVGLTSFIKHREIVGLFTATTPTLLGGTSVTESHISTITDTIILIRYVEIFGDIRRGLVVLKMRGSKHEKEIREFTIDDHGMHIGLPFKGISGILAGKPVQAGFDEIDRLDEMFKTT